MRCGSRESRVPFWSVPHPRNAGEFRPATKQPAIVSKIPEAWSTTHDLALVFLALAYGTDKVLVDEELQAIVSAIRRWQPSWPEERVHEIVMESLAVMLEAEGQSEIVPSINRLRSTLEPASRVRAFEDLVRVAESDGLVLGSERSMLSILARAWEIKELPGPELDAGIDDDVWGVLHDVGLLFVAVAHGGDAQLSDSEIKAMIERMLQWQPELEEKGARKILREALHFYGTQPDSHAFSESVAAVRDAFPVPQRVAVLDDLMHIAAADGKANDNAREIISTLSRAWGIGLRTDATG